MRKAFTLVELLVVISIIAVLLSILMPSMAGMGEMTGLLKCKVNLGNISRAMYGYALDNNGIPCQPNWESVDRGWWSRGIRVKGWLYEYQRLGSSSRDDWLEGGVVYTYSGEKMSTLRCPEEPVPLGGFVKGTNRLTSYCMNGAVVSDGGRDTPYRLTTLIGLPKKAVGVWESNDALWNDGSSYPREGMAYYHKEGANYAAFDGSAPYIERDEFERLIHVNPSILNFESWIKNK